MVVERTDEDMGDKSGAVPPHPPALEFTDARSPRFLQLRFRNAGLYVFVGEEPGEVLAYDLFGMKPLDAFRAEIPTDDAPLGVEHDDGMILDAFHQQPELLLAPAQLPDKLLAIDHSAPHCSSRSDQKDEENRAAAGV